MKCPTSAKTYSNCSPTRWNLHRSTSKWSPTSESTSQTSQLIPTQHKTPSHPPFSTGSSWSASATSVSRPSNIQNYRPRRLKLYSLITTLSSWTTPKGHSLTRLPNSSKWNNSSKKINPYLSKPFQKSSGNTSLMSKSTSKNTTWPSFMPVKKVSESSTTSTPKSSKKTPFSLLSKCPKSQNQISSNFITLMTSESASTPFKANLLGTLALGFCSFNTLRKTGKISIIKQLRKKTKLYFRLLSKWPREKCQRFPRRFNRIFVLNLAEHSLYDDRSRWRWTKLLPH